MKVLGRVCSLAAELVLRSGFSDEVPEVDLSPVVVVNPAGTEPRGLQATHHA